MSYGYRMFGLAVGLVLAVAGQAFAQQINGLAVIPGGASAPVPPSPAAPGVQVIADTHVESTKLGFDKGVAPAPGRMVTFQGKEFQVVDVVAKGGGPTFAGGSQHVIGVNGSSLIVGLASAVPEKLVAGVSVPGTKTN